MTTIQESDEMILAALSPDSGTNESEEELETLDETEEEVVEETESEDEVETEVVAPTTQKNKSNFAKVIAERNELRRKLAEKESKYDKDSLDDIRAIVREETRQELLSKEKETFFSKNSIEQEAKEEIEAIMEWHSMDVNDAYSFYLVKTNPRALLDEQTIAKTEAKKYSVSWTSNRKATKVDIYSPEYMANFDKDVREGRIKP